MLAKSPKVTLYTGGSDGFVTSTAAPIATEWNEPVLGREFHPLWTSAFHGAQHSSTSGSGEQARDGLHEASGRSSRSGDQRLGESPTRASKALRSEDGRDG
jgi:hypothetical protein